MLQYWNSRPDAESYLQQGEYEFGYDTRGTKGGAKHFRHEKKDKDGTVKGHYGFIDANGDLHIIGYVTDPLGNR